MAALKLTLGSESSPVTMEDHSVVCTVQARSVATEAPEAPFYQEADTQTAGRHTNSRPGWFGLVRRLLSSLQENM
jgi:hypothetical protein